jgi:DnaJ-class molecular chaperone
MGKFPHPREHKERLYHYEPCPACEGKGWTQTIRGVNRYVTLEDCMDCAGEGLLAVAA